MGVLRLLNNEPLSDEGRKMLREAWVKAEGEAT